MRILCADDEPDLRTILALALGVDPRIEVEVFPSGEALIARAREGGADAVLLDAMMPGIDGYETCRRLKADAATAALPVVFLTARASAADEMSARAVGAVTTLSKPFDPLSLASQLLAALER